MIIGSFSSPIEGIKVNCHFMLMRVADEFQISEYFGSKNFVHNVDSDVTKQFACNIKCYKRVLIGPCIYMQHV